MAKTPKRKKKLPQTKQSARFIETARKIQVDESGEAFDRAFKKIAPPLEPKK